MRIKKIGHNKSLVVALLTLGVLFIAPVGYADQGFSVGIDLGIRDFIGSNIGKNINPGPGAGMYMQFGITDVLALKLGMLGSIHAGEDLQNNQSVNTSTLFGGMNIGVDFDLIPHAVLQPIIDIGVGGYRLGSNYI